MAFDLIERSNHDAIPSTLFEFIYQNRVWRYTGNENDIVVSGMRFEAKTIKYERYNISGDTSINNLNVVMQRNLDFVDFYSKTPPGRDIKVNIRKIHRGDSEAPVVWSGIVRSGKGNGETQYTVVCNSIMSTLDRTGLRLAWSRNCPYPLYGPDCKVTMGSRVTTVYPTAISGVVVTVSPAQPNGVFSGGMMSYMTDYGVQELRTVESQQGGVVRLLDAPTGMTLLRAAGLYPGCDRTTSTCANRFNNLANYGGFPFIPGKSPFDGNPVF